MIFLNMAAHNDLGKWGEEKATQYLIDKGYNILKRNWRVRHRDLDIVAIDGDELVIVEVKTRRNQVFTTPESAVDWRKIRSLTFATHQFLKINRINANIRFDIITVTGIDDVNCTIRHIKDAFLPARI